MPEPGKTQIFEGSPFGEIPEQYAGLQIVEQIGQGGMGSVYKGLDPELDCFRAVKMLARQLAADPAFVQRFREEARMAARLDSPYAVRVIRFGMEADRYFLIMEFVDGPTLESVCAREQLDPNRALHVAGCIGQALRAAHRLDVIHRDIKPANILFTPDNIPKLADFGIARPIKREGPNLTTEGTVIGTPAFMSPEQAAGKEELDGRTDVYSLGATLYWATTGIPPFTGERASQILEKVIHDTPHAPIEICPEMSAEVSDLIVRMMVKDRDERIASAEDLIREVSRLQGGTVRTEAHPAPEPKPRRRVVRNVLATVLPLLMIALLAGFFYRYMLGRKSDAPVVAKEKQSAARKANAAKISAATRSGRTAAPAAKEPAVTGKKPEPKPAHANSPEPEKPGPPTTFTNTLGMKMVLIPAGKFMMGSPKDEAGRGKGEPLPHQVTIKRPFYIAACEVTNAEFHKFRPQHKSAKGDARLPVTDVSWNDARAFCKWISEKGKRRYRLPTEAEWEYACRAGAATAFSWGDKFDPKKAWDGGKKGPKPVGSFPPNKWGLYDMHGNVWEWTEDKAGDAAELRVCRSGGSGQGPSFLRCAARITPSPGAKASVLGLRVCCDAPPSAKDTTARAETR